MNVHSIRRLVSLPRGRTFQELLPVLLTLALAGCAAIFSSGPTALTFRSDPEGAQVLLNGVPHGTTPVVLELQADEDNIVTFRRAGCSDVTLPLETHVQAGFVILDLLAGIIGIAVDAATGEWKEFNDRTSYARLECSEEARPGPAILEVPAPVGPPAPGDPRARAQVPARAEPPERPVTPEEAAPGRAPGQAGFAGGRWTGTIAPRRGEGFQAAITLNDLALESRGGAVAGLATYTSGRTTCVYRLTVETWSGSRLGLHQSLESPQPRCAEGLRLVIDPVAGGALAVALEGPHGAVRASGLLQPTGCELIRGAWRPANCPPR